MDELLIRQAPHSPEAEQAVLGSMLIDADCVKDVMDKLQPGQGESCPLVTGLTLTSPQLGQLAVPENQDKWDLLQQLWRLLRGKDMAGDVQSIDLTDTGRITLRYLDRFDVVLKSDDDLDYRLNYLAAVIQRLDGSDQGTIQWDKDGKARFIPG